MEFSPLGAIPVNSLFPFEGFGRMNNTEDIILIDRRSYHAFVKKLS